MEPRGTGWRGRDAKLPELSNAEAELYIQSESDDDEPERAVDGFALTDAPEIDRKVVVVSWIGSDRRGISGLEEGDTATPATSGRM